MELASTDWSAQIWGFPSETRQAEPELLERTRDYRARYAISREG
jgi:hypothetical protein